MKIKLQAGMKLRLREDKEWELGRVEAGTVGQVGRIRLACGILVFAMGFPDRQCVKETIRPYWQSRTLCFGLPAEVSAEEYEVVEGGRE